MVVTVYSTPSCPYCVMAKKYLAANNVEYQDINVAEDHDAAEEMIKKSGQRGVPVIDINGTIILGFDVAAIKQALGLK